MKNLDIIAAAVSLNIKTSILAARWTGKTIMGFDHLTVLCQEFTVWYNDWRPHMTLDGARPDDVYYDRALKKPGRDAKRIPPDFETRFFSETRTTGYRLKEAA